MQSGITASSELLNAFSKFASTPSQFCLPITIQSESLVALDPISWPGSSGGGSSAFKTAVPKISPILKPKEPLFLLLRKDAESSSSSSSSSAAGAGAFIAVTYIPSTAPVRSKTLFASTRTTLMRELGGEKFQTTYFCTDAEEVCDFATYKDSFAASNKAEAGGVDVSLLSLEERELQSVKRAEDEERHGTSGRDLMGAGGSGRAWVTNDDDGGAAATSGGTSSSAGGTTGGGVRMKMTDEAKKALQEFASSTKQSGDGEGQLVQFGLDISNEMVTLAKDQASVSSTQVSKTIPTSHPSYTLYHFPSTQTTLFIYVCPGTSKVKERMMYASSRNGVVQVAQAEGITVNRKIEAEDPDELAESRLSEELGIKKANTTAAGGDDTGTSRGGFARPKRPGKR